MDCFKTYLINDSIRFNLSTKDTIDIVVEREKYGKFKFVNLLKRRPVVYKANGIMTRPNSSVIINKFKIKK